MSTRRWVFLAVTLISAISFLVDQVFLSAPDSAVADLTADAAGRDDKAARPARQAAPSANAAPVVPELDDPSLPYLNKLPPIASRRDIFSPSPEMLKYYQDIEEKQDAGATAAGLKPGSPQAFEAEYKLQATFNSPDGAMAVINGKMLRVGHELAGFRLMRIGPYHAEFKRNQERLHLYIPTPDSTTPKAAPSAPTPPTDEEPSLEQEQLDRVLK